MTSLLPPCLRPFPPAAIRWAILLGLLAVGPLDLCVGAEVAPGRLPLYVRKLQDKQKSVRLAAIRALGDLGTAGKAAVPHLADLLRHKDLELRRQAALALARIGTPAVPALCAALKDDRTLVRFWAAEALAAIGPDAKEAVPALVAAVTERNVELRISIIKALATVGGDDDSSRRVLTERKKDKNLYVRLLAEAALNRPKPGKEGDSIPLMPPPVLRLQRFTPAQEAMVDRAVDIWIVVDTHDRPKPRLSEEMQRDTLPGLVFMMGPEAIPPLVRGFNKSLVLRTDCPVGSLGPRLRDVIASCDDPVLLDYVLTNVGTIPATPTGLPAPRWYGQIIRQIRAACIQRKAELALLVIEAERQAAFNRLLKRTFGLRDRDVLAQLAVPDADARLCAVSVTAHRRLHAEPRLIDRLNDTDPRVVQAARQALSLLARGTDFGPAPKARPAARRLAQKRWRNWWAYQDTNPDAKKLPAFDDLPPPVPEAQQLADKLVKAKVARQPVLLNRLRKAKGEQYTEALAEAIPRLGESVRDQARDVLAERLQRVPPKPLRGMLGGSDVELRRAAARACARKADREFVPDLIGRLTDPEPEVAAAARAALRELTGEDFGPKAGATTKECAAAAKKWRDWWAKQEER